jgi:isopentenyldiphosphate isomerase
MGNPANIVYRSLWERRVMVMLDEREDIVEWGSEELKIPYRSPLDKRIHHYYPDFQYKHTKTDGTFGFKLCEVKPYKQTVEPVRPKDRRSSKKYIREVTTYLVNKAKWDAAEAYCADKGWEFIKITEHNLPDNQPK